MYIITLIEGFFLFSMYIIEPIALKNIYLLVPIVIL